MIAAIDSDGDHVISAREIMNAADALKKLDQNQDGQLTADEMHAGAGRPEQGERGSRDGQPGERPDGPPPQGGPGGPPTAEKFMQHAMTVHADQDGLLNKAELQKMAAAIVEEMLRRGGPPGGPRHEGQGSRGGNRKRPNFE